MGNESFQTSANQRHITVHKPYSKPGDYNVVNLNANRTALNTLSYSAYMLYMYFCLHADRFETWLSKEHVCQNTAFTKNTYYKAFNELVETGYLVQRATSNTFYDFFESSPKQGSALPENRKACTENCENKHQKKAENINKQRNNVCDADAITPYDKDGSSHPSLDAWTLGTSVQNHPVFFDM